MKLTFDFTRIHTMEDFYEALEEKLELPPHFGRNLDALYDVISGDLPLPLHVKFVEMGLSQLEPFDPLLETMEDLEEALEEFEFTYRLRTIRPEDF